MTATDDDIAKLEEALAAATPGPWEVTPDSNMSDVRIATAADMPPAEHAYGRYTVVGSSEWTFCRDEDATAIVAAVNLAPALIARLRAAEARLLPEKLTDKQREMLARAVMEWGSSEDWVSLSDHMKGVYRGMANDFHAILSRIQKEAQDEG